MKKKLCCNSYWKPIIFIAGISNEQTHTALSLMEEWIAHNRAERQRGFSLLHVVSITITMLLGRQMLYWTINPGGVIFIKAKAQCGAGWRSLSTWCEAPASALHTPICVPDWLGDLMGLGVYHLSNLQGPKLTWYHLPQTGHVTDVWVEYDTPL